MTHTRSILISGMIFLLLTIGLSADVYDIQKGVFITLQATDAYTTIAGINSGITESNGVVSYLVGKSPVLFVTSKVIVTYSCLLVTDYMYDRSPLAANLTLLTINLIHGYFVCKNISVCFSLRF